MGIRPRGCSWQVSMTVNGRRIRKSFKTRGEAEVYATSLEALTQQPESPPAAPFQGRPRTMAQLLQMTYERYWKSSRSGKSLFGNARAVVHMLGPDTPPSQIDLPRIDKLIADLASRGNSNATINRKLSALSRMLTFAARRNFIKQRPVIERLRKDTHRIRYLSDVEEERLVATLRHFGGDDVADLCVVLVDTGLRVGEALRLKHEDIEDGRWVRVWQSKNDVQRSVPATTRVQAILAARQGNGSERVFPTLTMNRVRHAWDRAADHMGLAGDRQFVPHALRHTFVSRLVQRRVPLAVVRDLAGHKSLSMTLRYAHLAPQNLEEAISVLEPGKAKDFKLRLVPEPATDDPGGSHSADEAM